MIPITFLNTKKEVLREEKIPLMTSHNYNNWNKSVYGNEDITQYSECDDQTENDSNTSIQKLIETSPNSESGLYSK